MYNFTIIKKGLLLLSFSILGVASSFAQTDTVQYSTDTTTVKIQNVKLTGEKISGLVIDGNTKKPLIGVRLTVANFSAALTDDKGKFAITVPNYNSTIAVSFVGYHTKIVPVHKGKLATIIIWPDTYNSVFTEVDLPMGKQSLARTSAAVDVFKPQGAWNNNSETPMSDVQGKLTGLNAIRKSGTQGIGADVFIRGFSSLYATNQPLYVVDGMIYDVNSYGASLTLGHRNNPLQGIDLRDIESVTLIKDAAATAVYGTKAANGILSITTNRAKDLATQIDFSAYAGINLKPKNLAVMDAADYRIYLTDVLSSQGLTAAQIAAKPYMNDNTDPVANPTYYMYHNNTNWQKEVLKSSFDQNYYVKVSGGDNIAKYALSVGYLSDKGVIDSTGNNRYNMRFNSDLNLTKKLQANTNLSFTYTEQRLKDQGIAPITNPIFLSLVKAPFLAVNEVSSTGAVSPNLADYDTLQVSNPRALIEKGLNLKKAYRFFGNINFDYTFSKSFKISNLTGVTYDKTQETTFVPRKGVANYVLPTTFGDSRSGTQVIRYFSVFDDLRLTFDKKIGQAHNIHAVAGTRFMSSQSEQDNAIGYNTATDALIGIGNTNAALRYLGGDLGRWSSLNSYLTADYNYKETYYVSAAVAVDQSSRFGRADISKSFLSGKTAILPALSAAWLISSEDFMRDYKYIDLLKLRTSLGYVGNDDIGNYNNRQYYVSQNLLGLQGLVRGNVANPNIQWEEILKFNFGADMSVFNERLSLSIDYFQNTTYNMLTYVPINSVGGITTFIDNQGTSRMRGFELGLNGRILNNNLKWDIGVNLGTYKNEIRNLPGSADIITTYAGGTYLTRKGETANMFYGHRTNGVYASDAEASAAGLSIINAGGVKVPFKGGDMRFVDTNGDKIVDDADRTIIGDPNPALYGSINNSFNYKRWDLSILFSFVTGNDLYNYTRAQLESGSTYYNQTDALRNRWRGNGQVTNVPKASFGDPMGNARFSDRWIEDGSYLRLRTVNLSYNIPMKTKGIKYVKVYGTANNVFTLTNYLGYDPEFSAGSSIFNQGVDTTLEPQFRSFQLGVRVGL
ncbi:SusC/RagA family TonB-linked outer membrane protein [Pedobacter frigiditerrae]|uniref:SusC/RagA family TonB-linked outer membrane protein n=1 Tax=Pedobacter frigiditerrae TaxID=2530452 RepID=UPI00292E8480|nr:SusC/RagA family TonB-linked outer membrane protein [Pedobacter frigiditerrae]